jgi:hypothetical protein
VGIREVIGRPFAFLFQRTQKEELVAEYVIREHHKGRSLQEILEDAYVTNRLTPEQTQRLLDRPEVVQAVGNDMIAELRRGVGQAPEPPATGS